MKVIAMWFVVLVMSVATTVSVVHADPIVEKVDNIIHLDGEHCVKVFEGVNYPHKQLAIPVACGHHPIEGYTQRKDTRYVCVALTDQECRDDPTRIVKTTESVVQLKTLGNKFIGIIQIMPKKGTSFF